MIKKAKKKYDIDSEGRVIPTLSSAAPSFKMSSDEEVFKQERDDLTGVHGERCGGGRRVIRKRIGD